MFVSSKVEELLLLSPVAPHPSPPLHFSSPLSPPLLNSFSF